MDQPNSSKPFQISEKLYQDIYEAAPFGIYTLDSNGNITSFNPKMQELSGDSAEEAIGLNVFDMESYKNAGLDSHFAKALQDRIPFETEVRYISHVGKKLSIRHYRGIPVNQEQGDKSAKLLLIVEDVTQKRQMEETLKKTLQDERLEHERLRLLINSLNEAVIATDNHGNIIIYNGATLDLLNTNTNLRGENITKYLDTYELDESTPVKLLEQARNLQSPLQRDDILLKIDDNDYINLYANISPIYASYDVASEYGFMFLLRDITKEKNIESERDEFVSVTSHELRTPLATAEAALSNAMLPDILNKPEEAGNMIKQAHAKVVMLGELVENLSLLTQINNNEIHVTPTEVELDTVLEAAKRKYQDAADNKSLQLNFSSSQDISKINTDRDKLAEIVDNLISNAVKYTDKGHVDVEVKPSEKFEGGAVIAVKDTGSGISTHDQKMIFNKFYRSEDWRTRETEGTGLGLHVSKMIAELLGGSLTVESRIESGSVFYLELPSLE